MRRVEGADRFAVANITANFEFAPAAGHDVWPVHRVTPRPRGGLPMTACRRETATLVDVEPRSRTFA